MKGVCINCGSCWVIWNSDGSALGGKYICNNCGEEQPEDV